MQWDGAASSAAAGDATRQSGANIRSLNKRSLRTLKGNEAQGTTVAVCVYLDREQYKIQKKHTWREERKLLETVLSSWMVAGFAHITITCNHAINCARGKRVIPHTFYPKWECLKQYRTHTQFVLTASLQLF